MSSFYQSVRSYLRIVLNLDFHQICHNAYAYMYVVRYDLHKYPFHSLSLSLGTFPINYSFSPFLIHPHSGFVLRSKDVLTLVHSRSPKNKNCDIVSTNVRATLHGVFVSRSFPNSDKRSVSFTFLFISIFPSLSRAPRYTHLFLDFDSSSFFLFAFFHISNRRIDSRRATMNRGSVRFFLREFGKLGKSCTTTRRCFLSFTLFALFLLFAIIRFFVFPITYT